MKNTKSGFTIVELLIVIAMRPMETVAEYYTSITSIYAINWKA